MRILLAYKVHAAGAEDPYTSLLPVGLGYINALLRAQGFSSSIANLSKSGWKETGALLKSERPQMSLSLSMSSRTSERSGRATRIAAKYGLMRAGYLAGSRIDRQRALTCCRRPTCRVR